MPEIGINGAAIGSVVCHIIAFLISFIALKRNIKIEFKFIRCIFKPIIATIIMTVCSLFVYTNLGEVLLGHINGSEKITTLVAIITAGIMYVLSIFLLKILTKEELCMLPYGKKIYRILVKMRIYKKA